MKVVFRADASIKIGTGHVMRCLTLAEELRERGAEVCFACVALPGNLITYVREQGYACHVLAKTDELIMVQGDWLVVDHYQLDYEWENLMRAHFHKVFVIDDLANRKHDCDILLDQNRINGSLEIYQELVPEKAKLLLGPQYALLRKEFLQKEEEKKGNDLPEAIKECHVLVSFGGSDPTHETIKILRTIIAKQPENMTFDVIIGNLNEDLCEIEAMVLKESRYIVLHKNANNMAKLMRCADIGIGAGGATTWERLCCGVPSLLIIVAENQREIAYMVEKVGAGIVLGESPSVTGEDVWRALVYYIQHPLKLKKMAMIGKALIDGNGCARVAGYFEDV